MLYFITGNSNKFDEIQALLPVPIERLSIDLPEVQEIDAKLIIEAKLKGAFEHHNGPFIVEDTSLCLDALGGLPGPFIKWFEKTVTCKGLADIAEKMSNTNAHARVLIGYAKDKDSIQYFEGVLDGDIVQPRGTGGFGWDVIFQPKGGDRTMAEMSQQEKNEISMRRNAAMKLAVTLS